MLITHRDYFLAVSNLNNLQSKAEITKRSFLRSAAALSIGSAGVAQSVSATAENDDEEWAEINSDKEEILIRKVQESEQFDTLRTPVTDGNFIPQFDSAEGYYHDAELDRNKGYRLYIPTKNEMQDDSSVQLIAFQPKLSPEDLILKAVAYVDEAPVGALITDNELVEEAPGYKATNGLSVASPGSGFLTAMWDIPDVPIPDVPDVPGIGDVRDLIDDAAQITGDVYSETATWAASTTGVVSAVDISDAWDFTIDNFSPVNRRKPPEGLREFMNDTYSNSQYLLTIDLKKSCAYIAIGALTGTVLLTVCSLGTGAAIAVALGKAATTACGLAGAVNHFTKDIFGRSADYAYIYAYEDKDETKLWAFPWFEQTN